MASPSLASDPRRYSVEEMISLKTSLPVVNCVIKKLNKHPDIAAIFRIPEEAFKDPERYYCQSQALVDVTNRRKILQLPNRHAEVSSELRSSEESEAEVVPSSKLRNHTRSEQWQLRRRDSSHRSSEPHSAPSGIASQQNENFQRFYRAVVSPTHVRVTAGGRIVPNTRATAPPQFSWNPDKYFFEPRNKLADIELNTPQARPLWLPNSSEPGIPSPLLPATLPNYNFLPQGNSLIQATMATQNLNEAHGNAQKTSENAYPPKEAANDPVQPVNLQSSIKISPPSQFDHSRPFIFNGQIVYPVPAGFQPPINSVPLPITVLGDPNLPHQVAPTGGFLPPPYPMPIPLGNFASPFMMSSGPIGHVPAMMSNGISHLESGLPLGPYIPQPAAGMVSLSELTKFQLQGFRNQVKLIDDQLANNKHLIDEPFLQRQRSELMTFIERMEAMLQTQLGQEGNITASNERDNTEALGKSDIKSVTEPNESSMSNSSLAPNEQLKKKGSTMVSQAMVPPIPLFVPTSQLPTTKTKSEDIRNIKAPVTLKPLTQSEPATKSKLTAAAAKAPPFQPRALTMTYRSESEPVSDIATLASSDSNLLPSPSQGLTPQAGPLGNRRTAYSSSDWGQPILHPGVNHANLIRAHTMQISDVLNGNNTSLLQRSHTFHAPASTYESAIRPGGPLVPSSPAPYLIGTVPHGMSISDARGFGFAYSRPLTEDEIRARYLYWGNAPRSAMKGSGLPKFDGKDFYPPSPVKRIATPAATSDAQPKTSIAQLPDFENLFTESGGSGYRPPAHAEQQLAPTPTRVFLGQNDIIGYESPSPRVATYSFENKVPANWSPRKWGININSILPQTAHSAAPEPANPLSDDFSTLFTSPIGPQPKNSSQGFRDGGLGQPTTPKNKVLGGSAKDGGDEPRTVDSWGASKNVEDWNREDREENISTKTNTNYSLSNASTVEIRLTPKDKDQAPEREFGSGFSEQLAMASGKDTQFLQNMLKATAAASMAAPAFSSATAVGYLPQYRGTAAASLAPAMLFSMKALEREDEIASVKADQIDLICEGVLKVSTEGVAPLIAANFLPEDRPVNRDRPRKPIRASIETMGAERYMRYLSQKAEADKKILEQGWNPNTTGTGPVMGSDW